MICHNSRPPVPSLRGRRSCGTIWSASCGFSDFRETLRGGFVVTRIPLLTLALATLVGVAAVSAQQRQITGRVTSGATNEPVAGVTVSVTGTAFAAVTNSDGRYAIPAPGGTVTLVFRRIAFKRREVQVPADQTTADATLEPDVFNLEAVVVTGQATGVERRNAAIATSGITGSEGTSGPAPAGDRAPQGRGPGGGSPQKSGGPGGGAPTEDTGRDAAGGPRANIVQRVGFSELQRGFDTRVFDTTSAIVQYATIYDDLGNPIGIDSASRALIMSYLVNGRLPTYDHLREVAGEKPINYETQLDVSGGSGQTRYFLSGNVKGDGGIIANTGAQRQTLRANIDQSFSDRFSVAFSSAFNRTTTQRGFTNNDNNGASITYGIAYIPGFVNIEPVNGVFPNPGITYKASNPLQTIALGKNDEVALRFTGGLTATYQAIASAHHNLKLVGDRKSVV